MTHTPAILTALLAGTTLLLTPSLAGQVQKGKAKARVETVDAYSLAFADADVKRVIDAVLGSMIGVDYSIDPEITGTITLRTSKPVPRSELLPLLETALKPLDAAILVDGRSYRVVKIVDARARAGVASAAPRSDDAPQVPGFASESFTLKYGSAREVARMLQEMLGKEAVSDAAGLNQVTVTGTAEERQAARELVKRLDVDTLADMNFEFYRLENVDPGTLVTELERIFQPPYDIIGSRVRVVPLPRLRSVMIIASERADIQRIEPWVRRLDIGVSGKRKLYSYAVQNGRAKDLASALQQVLGQSNSGTASEAAASSQSRPEAGLGATGEDATKSELAAPDTRAPDDPNPSSSVRIVPVDSTNTILIHANGEEYEFIREAIAKLDQPVAQVLIEATLAEVTLSDDLRYGVNFRSLSGITTIANSATASSIPAAVFPGFSVSVVGNDVSGVLNTLQSKTNVRVLSAPKLIVLNNHTATLQVGDQVPIIVQQQQSVASPGAPVVNTIELRDTGVILKVTPRVNDSGAVTLDIDQEVSDVAQTTTSGINSPTIQQRRLSSTVTTRTGQMIALGGLIRDRVTRNRSGIPLISQIPLIGGAFGSHNKGGGRTELIILLTPTVIRSPDEVKNVVDALIDGLDASRPLVDRARQSQVGGNPIPRLPPLPIAPPPHKKQRR